MAGPFPYVRSASSQPGSGLAYYWAASPDEELGPLMMEWWRLYLTHLLRSGRLELWRRAHNLYYGLDADGGWSRSSAVAYGGEGGEYVQLRVNEFRSLLEHTHTLITGTRPTLIARGMNASAKSQTAARLAEGVFEYYLEEQKLEQAMQQASRFALRYGEGWVYSYWDPDAGEAYDVEQQEGPGGETVDRVVYQGEIRTRALMPIDVIRDPAWDVSAGEEPWVIVHTRRSRWDLIALYPELKEELLNAPSCPQLPADLWSDRDKESRDLVSCLELYHARTPALPQGRYAMTVGDLMLFSGALPYDTIPVVAMRPDTETKTAFGYTTSWDLMGLQEVLDSIVSTVASNHDAYALRNIWLPLGSGLSVSSLRGGLKLLESREMPQRVDLMPDLTSSVNFSKTIMEHMSSISGINNVARGQPDPNVKSGAMAALIHSMAVQYNSGLQASYAQLFERVGTHFLDVARRYMTTPRLVAISGPRGSAWVKDFRGSDIDGVRRIAVDTGNAITRTSAGRQEIATQFLTNGIIPQDPQGAQQYLQMISTGRFEPLTDRPDTKLRGIQAENDRLVLGEEARVLITDDHVAHIEAHMSLLDEPSVRDDDEIAAVILDHVQTHMELYQQASTVNPGLMTILGIPPFPGGPGEGMAPPGGPPMNPGGDVQAPMAAPEPVAAGLPPGAPDVQAARMPTLPGQQGQYDPATGQSMEGA
jgi:hypothetical protein